jgi:hypothetical protein
MAKRGFKIASEQSVRYFCSEPLKPKVMNSIFVFFIQGNPVPMGIITLILVLVFLAAWKAPAWVSNLGKLGLVTGILGTLFGISQMLDYLGGNAETPAAVIYRGLKVTLIPLYYGIFVYIIGLIISTVQKPRLR